MQAPILSPTTAVAELPSLSQPLPQIEIINGIEFVMPSPTLLHQSISMNLVLLLSLFVKARKCGKVFAAPMDVILEPKKHVVQPDIIYVSNERKEILQKWINGAPDLVCEIVSLDYNKDIKSKYDLYAQFGILEYWIIEPQSNQVRVYVLNSEQKYVIFSEAAGNGIVHSKVLAGFRVEIAEIFTM